MRIRKAVPQDAPRIAELLQAIGALHHRLLPGFFGAGAKYDESAVTGLMDDMTIFVADDNGDVAGYVFCKVRDYDAYGLRLPYRCLWVDDLCVGEACRGRGIASALMDAAADFGREQGCVSVELNVWEANADALRFYEHIGMTTQRRIMEIRL